MITPKILELERQLNKVFPDFRTEKTLMLLPPLDRVLRGIWFDRSAYDEISFSVIAFVIPLCVETDHLYFNYSESVRHNSGGDRWRIDMPDLLNALTEALRNSALPLLSRGATLDGFIEIARSGPQTGRNLEGLGYALARAGKTEEAISVLNQLASELNPSIIWQLELSKKVREFITILMEHPDDAELQLAMTEEKTIHNLGLEKFRLTP